MTESTNGSIYTVSDIARLPSICVMIPVTSKGREWNTFKDTDLYNIFFKSFFRTYNKELNHLFCFAIDSDDDVMNNMKDEIQRNFDIMKNSSVKFISTDEIEKGHVTQMWNRCFKYGIQENYDYFLQCGDDIDFLNDGWENAFIRFLEGNRNVGVCGFSDMGRLHYNQNDRLITQSFVHRTHYEIFGSYFPKKIINWGCDDWITEIYNETGDSFYSPLHMIVNKGGEPRYDIVNNRNLWKDLIKEDYPKINCFKWCLQK